VFELSLYRSLYLWARRRPVAAGDEPFSYVGAVTLIIWVFIILSAIEVPVLHVVLPWATAQTLSLVLGFWGLTWMVGLLASLHVHPHIVSDSGLRVRYGSSIDITIPWEDVSTIRHRRRDLPSSRTVHVDRTETGAVAVIGVSSQTNVEVMLREPRPVPLHRGTSEPVTELRFFADDPRTLVVRARSHLASDR